jgi:hypothetical protein
MNSFDMWVFIILVVLCIPVIYTRLGERKAERFEDRDN